MTRHRLCWLCLLLWAFASANLHADIRIFGLEDFNLGRWILGVGSLQANANLCVVVRPPGPYQVTAYGSGVSNAFTLSNGADDLPYRLFFNDRPRPNGATELVAAQALGGLRGRRRGIRNNQCNRPTANISIFVSDTELSGTTSGRYSGTVLIVVGPE